MIDVYADGMASGSGTYPLARRTRGTAEILSETHRVAAPEIAESVVQKLDLGFYILHGFFIELMKICLFSHGWLADFFCLCACHWDLFG